MVLVAIIYTKLRNSYSHLLTPPQAVAGDMRQELTLLGCVNNNIKNKYLDTNIRKKK